jgi:hypothetical protein
VHRNLRGDFLIVHITLCFVLKSSICEPKKKEFLPEPLCILDLLCLFLNFPKAVHLVLIVTATLFPFLHSFFLNCMHLIFLSIYKYSFNNSVGQLQGAEMCGHSRRSSLQHSLCLTTSLFFREDGVLINPVGLVRRISAGSVLHLSDKLMKPQANHEY